MRYLHRTFGQSPSSHPASDPMAESTSTMSMYFNAVAAFMTALLPLRYPNQNPFLTLPTTMLVLVLSTILHYLLLIGILLFPRSRFSALAKHLTPFFAYATISALVAALFPGHCATTSIYITSGLLVLGHVLFVAGVEDDDDRVYKDEVHADRTWYEGFTTRCHRYKNKLARIVAGFFKEQTTQPAEPPLPC